MYICWRLHEPFHKKFTSGVTVTSSIIFHSAFSFLVNVGTWLSLQSKISAWWYSGVMLYAPTHTRISLTLIWACNCSYVRAVEDVTPFSQRMLSIWPQRRKDRCLNGAAWCVDFQFGVSLNDRGTAGLRDIRVTALARSLDFRRAPTLKIGKYASGRLCIYLPSLSLISVQAGGVRSAPNCTSVRVSGKVTSKRRDVLFDILEVFAFKVFKVSRWQGFVLSIPHLDVPMNM